ncbi:hypothetical protein E4U10_001179 [Claviceps purpurea]|nr:hypothetical protein E4U10_001179 [Claviceps purpurea]
MPAGTVKYLAVQSLRRSRDTGILGITWLRDAWCSGPHTDVLRRRYGTENKNKKKVPQAGPLTKTYISLPGIEDYVNMHAGREFDMPDVYKKPWREQCLNVSEGRRARLSATPSQILAAPGIKCA